MNQAKQFSWDDVSGRVRMGLVPRVSMRDWFVFAAVVSAFVLIALLSIAGSLVAWHALGHAWGFLAG